MVVRADLVGCFPGFMQNQLGLPSLKLTNRPKKMVVSNRNLRISRGGFSGVNSLVVSGRVSTRHNRVNLIKQFDYTKLLIVVHQQSDSSKFCGSSFHILVFKTLL